MPNKKLENYRVGKTNDKRRKLNDEDKAYIKQLHFRDKLGVREIARLFEGVCSRRLIQFVLFPERLEALQKHNKETKHHLKYYDKEKHRKYMRSHRQHKRKLLIANK